MLDSNGCGHDRLSLTQGRYSYFERLILVSIADPLAALGADWRGQGEHAFDSEWHVPGRFSDHHFAVIPGVTRQVNKPRVGESVHELMRHDRVRRSHEIIKDARAQVEPRLPSGSRAECV